MNRITKLLLEPRTGKKNLGRALHERDENASFDRCMVGGESCKETAINAHCVPVTVLELIMDESKEVMAVHSEPPKTPIQWLNREPLRPMNIEKFNASRWACRPHDDTFRALDTKALEELSYRDKFLMIYKITVYLTQRILHAGERLATPFMDPTTETPRGLSQETEEYLQEAALEMTYAARRTIRVKWQLDRMLNNKTYDEIEYRLATWRSTPTMAAVGMVFAPGPGDRAEWYGPNSYIPTWLALLPQEHGQMIITASPKGTAQYTRDIHEGMPRGQAKPMARGNNWTRLVCRKALTHATDIAINKERFSDMTEDEQRKLQEFILFRKVQVLRRRRLVFPNLLNIR